MALYLRKNAELINFSGIARRLNLDISTLHRAINGQTTVRGITVKIPRRCEGELRRVIEQLLG